MKVLVTGGAGFIGSHIVDLLLKRGYDVAVVDDLSTGSLGNLNPGAKFYRLSINDSELETLFAQEKPDVVCHQAAHTVVTESVKNPAQDAQTNILGSLNVLSNAVRYGVKRFVFASSCAVYGNPEYLPVNEAHPINPLAPYGVAKYTIEHYLRVYRSIYGLSNVALRYANVFGPRQNARGEAGVVAIFTRKMLEGEQPVIFGKGDKTRAYVYVEDVARANLLAIESSCQDLMNIGTNTATTDREVFDTLARELGYAGAVRYEDVRAGEINHMVVDSSRAKAVIGWEAQVSFRDGISATAAFYKSAKTKVTSR